MSDLREKRELSKMNRKKCQFCNCSSYVKPGCKVKQRSAIVKISNEDLKDVNSKICVKEKQLKMLEAEQGKQ
jgi:putative ribosome biogenesis GTPase RsgA